MKRICIITISHSVAEFYKEEIESLFGPAVQIDVLSVETTGLCAIGDCDLYLVGVTSSEFYAYVLSMIDDADKVVISQLTYRKKDLAYLKTLEDKEAMLVNLSENMAKEAIADLYRLGIGNLIFHPYYPNATNRVLPLAITPGERRFVPEGAERIIDIGNRYLSANTITEMALKLEMRGVLTSQKYHDYVDKLAETDYSINRLKNERFEIENKFEILVERINVGIVSISKDARVTICNNAAAELLGYRPHALLEKDVSEVFPEWSHFLKESDVSESFLMEVEGEELSVRIVPIVNHSKLLGHYLLINRFSDMENQQINLRKQLRKKENSTRYTFDDIITEDPSMIRAKSIAKKMAATNLSILLTGESGTGKELFAHAIHHASHRKDYPFIAINCSAIPDNLLESELFGYVGGAFTGAIKNGKIGLFEHAHKGSIFLDEIETMSPYLQSKLLRVLEEKEIMKIGDSKTIDIDVRIIAATNENIYQKVKVGEFRKDLYYRLNTLPIDIPPLRERKKDILVLADIIKKSIGASYELSQECQELFINHPWEGNVRELKNIMEYLKFMDNYIILKEHLPSVMLNNESEGMTVSVLETLQNEKEQFVLKALYLNPKGLGRAGIAKLGKDWGLTITEGEIRKVLKDLSMLGVVVSSGGRGGSRLKEAYFSEVEKIIG